MNSSDSHLSSRLLLLSGEGDDLNLKPQRRTKSRLDLEERDVLYSMVLFLVFK